MENAVKRNTAQRTEEGLTVRDVILVGTLLAAGAVLKFFVGAAVSFGGMKPNFIIAMYCLCILLIRPKAHEAAAIGLIAGAICQLFPGTPYINLISEGIGGAAAYMLMRVPLRFKKTDLSPAFTTFFTTLISGFTYLGVLYLALYMGADVKPAALAVFAGIIFGTAFLNTLMVSVLYVPMRLALEKK